MIGNITYYFNLSLIVAEKATGIGIHREDILVQKPIRNKSFKSFRITKLFIK